MAAETPRRTKRTHVEFADSTIKVFVSGKSGGQTTIVATDAAAAGTVSIEVFVTAKPSAKQKGGKQKAKQTTNVSFDVALNKTLESNATPIQVAYAFNDALSTAKPGKDFKGPTSGTFTFQPGEFDKSITIQVNTARLKQPKRRSFTSSNRRMERRSAPTRRQRLT